MDKNALYKIGKVAYSKSNTIYNSYELAEKCIFNKIDGAFVECGVAQGSQIGAMLQALKENKEKREVYLFDSFKGIPLCGPEDDAQPGIGKPSHNVNTPIRERLVSSGVSVGTETQIKNNYSKWGLDYSSCHFIKGWFQDTVDKWSEKIGKIAILRLDGDLYESTIVCLNALYNFLVPGGYIIVDDYGLYGCKKAVHKYFGNDLKFNIVPGTQTVIWWEK